jgi:hypothetical protein
MDGREKLVRAFYEAYAGILSPARSSIGWHMLEALAEDEITLSGELCLDLEMLRVAFASFAKSIVRICSIFSPSSLSSPDFPLQAAFAQCKGNMPGRYGTRRTLNKVKRKVI